MNTDACNIDTLLHLYTAPLSNCISKALCQNEYMYNSTNRNMNTKHPSSAAAEVQPGRAHDIHDRHVAYTTEYIMFPWNITYKIIASKRYHTTLHYDMVRISIILLKLIARITRFLYTHCLVTSNTSEDMHTCYTEPI